jgi:hypothetical protein
MADRMRIADRLTGVTQVVTLVVSDSERTIADWTIVVQTMMYVVVHVLRETNIVIIEIGMMATQGTDKKIQVVDHLPELQL